MNRTLRFAVAAAATGALAGALVLPSSPAGAKTSDSTLLGYAADTWRSMAAMADPGTGLVSDNVGADLSPASRAEYTSPTNIGAYMWSAIAARETKLISAAEARQRIALTLKTLPTLEKHEPSGMFYNWYDPATGEKLTVWPNDGSTVHPFVSSVDNGWLATGLELVIAEIPSLRKQAHRVLDQMDFGYYYNPAEKKIRGGFWTEPPPRLLGRRQLPWWPAGLLHVPPLRGFQHRAEDGQLPGHRGAADPAGALLRHLADVPADLRLVLGRAAPGRALRDIPRSAGLRGHLRLPRACGWCRPGVVRCSRR